MMRRRYPYHPWIFLSPEEGENSVVRGVAPREATNTRAVTEGDPGIGECCSGAGVVPAV